MFIICTSLLFFTCSVPVYTQEKTQTKYMKLENGLQVFLYERHNQPMVNIVIAVNLGSKDESDDTNGLVHILEHYIQFRGIKLRSGQNMSEDIRKYGAYFNAHTGRDLSLFETSAPSEHADFALKYQKELLFNLKLTQEELEKEKKVILEELNQIQDDPIKYSTSLVFQNLYRNHPYSRAIHGKMENIKAATVEQIGKFYRKYMVPSNCALAVVGDINIEEMEKKVKKIFGSVKKQDFTPNKFNKVKYLKKGTEIKKMMDVNQAYLVIGMTGPDYNNEDQYGIDVLTEILGRGINPMLYIPLTGRRILVNRVSMSYGAYKYSGAILIYITLDPRHIKEAKGKVIHFLKNLRRQNYSKKDYPTEAQMYAFDYLESAKNQIKLSSYQAQEKGLTLAVSLTRSMLLNEKQEKRSYTDTINRLTSWDLKKIAGKYFGRGRYVIVSILPEKKK